MPENGHEGAEAQLRKIAGVESVEQDPANRENGQQGSHPPDQG